jgi:transposase
MIDNPTSCEIHAVIHFIYAKSMSAEEIHRELCSAVYDQNVTSEGTVRQWCRVFKEGRTNLHDEGRSDRPAIYSE